MALSPASLAQPAPPSHSQVDDAVALVRAFCERHGIPARIEVEPYRDPECVDAPGIAVQAFMSAMPEEDPYDLMVGLSAALRDVGLDSRRLPLYVDLIADW